MLLSAVEGIHQERRSPTRRRHKGKHGASLHHTHIGDDARVAHHLLHHAAVVDHQHCILNAQEDVVNLIYHNGAVRQSLGELERERRGLKKGGALRSKGGALVKSANSPQRGGAGRGAVVDACGSRLKLWTGKIKGEKILNEKSTCV